MSDDLISRSALVKEIENMKVPISMPRVLDIISEQPTAYDVEEKIELIKKSKKRYTREILSNMSVTLLLLTMVLKFSLEKSKIRRGDNND